MHVDLTFSTLYQFLLLEVGRSRVLFSSVNFVHVLGVCTGKSDVGFLVAFEAVRVLAQRTAHCFLTIGVTDEGAVSRRTVVEGFCCLYEGIHETAVIHVKFLLTDAGLDVCLTHI